MALRMVRRGMLGFLLPLTLASNLLTFFLLARMTLLSDPSTSITISTTDPERGTKDRPVLERLVERISGGEWQKEHPEDAEFLAAQVYRDVAVVVPYRAREFHLRVFTSYMTTYLRLQNISYHIYVVEQSAKGLFNRALLLNVGFKEAMADHPYDCIIFHDVDLLPERPEMTYACQKDPVHMSVAVDTLNYSLPYPNIFGGVSALTPTLFSKINGFSNVYWGWGGEDDDIYQRLSAANSQLRRPSEALGRYTMLKGDSHVSSAHSESRHHYLRTSLKRMLKDGLNTVHKMHTVLNRRRTQTYTRLVVDAYPPWAAKRTTTKEDIQKLIHLLT